MKEKGKTIIKATMVLKSGPIGLENCEGQKNLRKVTLVVFERLLCSIDEAERTKGDSGHGIP